LLNYRGILACIVVFLAFGVTQAKDGPFLRPHPGRITLVGTIGILQKQHKT